MKTKSVKEIAKENNFCLSTLYQVRRKLKLGKFIGGYYCVLTEGEQEQLLEAMQKLKLRACKNINIDDIQSMMKEKNKSVREIADHYGVSTRAIYYHIRKSRTR